MKVQTVRLYQGVPMGSMGKIETFLSLQNRPYPGLVMTWEQGLLKIETKDQKHPKYIPASNIMFMEALDEDVPAKALRSK